MEPAATAGTWLRSRRTPDARPRARPARTRIAALLSIASWIAGVTAALPVVAATEGVLILHSNQRPLPAGMIIEEGLRAAVPQQLGRPVEIFSEYLDIEWTPGKEYDHELATLLRHKYSARNIRVIVASAGEAFRFALEHREPMLPGVPIVHVSLAREALEAASVPAGVAGRPVDFDPGPTLALALRLHPDAKRLVVVVGAAARDRAWERRIRDAITRLGTGIDVQYLSGLSNADVMRRVASLPRDSVVFTPGYFTDGAGEVGTPVGSAQRIASASSAPVYGALDTFVGVGVVGGFVTPFAVQGREAGALAVRLLNGAPIEQLDRSPLRQVPRVDWRQVRRWGIDDRLLPAGTDVAFREPTVWDRYAREISIGAAILLLQAALIAALLLERRSRQRTAKALRDSREQMSLAASAARLSLWVWDMARGKVRIAGQLHREGAPMSEASLDFEQVMASVHPADRAMLRGTVDKALASGDAFDVEYRTLDEHGGVRWVSARGRADRDGSKRLLGTAIDDTDRKATELRAAEDRAALRHMTRISVAGQLSAAIAHQLNQPLAAILGNAETARKMLGRDPVDVEELRAICDDIISEDRRAADIIRRLGDLYRRGDTRMAAVDVNRLVHETLELLRTELLTRHVTPVTDLAPALPPIEGSFVQLQQVVLNLALNAADALRATPADHRRLTIATEADEREVRLRVIDNGTGMSPDQIARVFEPFWSTKEAGMGMGLAICQTIVAAHRGRIEAVNNADNGATFVVALPVKRDR